MTEPVDGYTVWHEQGKVIMILSNRYGDDEQYTFKPDDAATLATALLTHARWA